MEATNAARAQAEAKKIDLEMQRQVAESQTAIKETQLRAQRLEAETEASSIRAMAEANYEKGCKEQEVNSRMPPQELELKRLELIVQAVQHYGQSAWRHPEEMQAFNNKLLPYLRIWPVSAAEVIGDTAKLQVNGCFQKYSSSETSTTAGTPPSEPNF